MPGASSDPRRALLLELFGAALAAVDGRRRMRAALASDRRAGPVSVFAAGKAAGSMMLGALDALGARLARGLAILPAGGVPAELAAAGAVSCREGGHPEPDESSLAAGQALAAFAAGTPPSHRVLLLVSGGASSLVEIPAPGVTLDALRAPYRESLAGALDIAALNARRRPLSAIKGGGLPRLFAGRALEAYLISDVPGDDPAVLASGLLDAPGLRPMRVGRLEDALEAVERAAIQRGLPVRRDARRLEGDAEREAHRICHELAVSGPGLLVAGGETTVRLPAAPGRGGRCQHFALAAARCIAGHDALEILAAGSDGRDGASEDAGAIVDGQTLARSRDSGLDAGAALAAADSGPVLEATGDLLYTGPTGTNVGDIVLALSLPRPVSGAM